MRKKKSVGSKKKKKKKFEMACFAAQGKVVRGDNVTSLYK